jgi:hypothetical protein
MARSGSFRPPSVLVNRMKKNEILVVEHETVIVESSLVSKHAMISALT